MDAMPPVRRGMDSSAPIVAFVGVSDVQSWNERGEMHRRGRGSGAGSSLRWQIASGASITSAFQWTRRGYASAGRHLILIFRLHLA